MLCRRSRRKRFWRSCSRIFGNEDDKIIYIHSVKEFPSSRIKSYSTSFINKKTTRYQNFEWRSV